MTQEAPCHAVVLTIVCVDDDLRSFCRHVSGVVARTSWRLARAFAVARQVHPQHPDALGTLATLMHCEFRTVETGTTVTDDAVAELLASLSGLEAFGVQHLSGLAEPHFPPAPR